MLIVCRKEGLLSNRLFHFSHLVSFAIENKEIIWYPYIMEFEPLFFNLKREILRNKGVLTYSSPVSDLLLKIVSWLLRRLPKGKFICSADANIDLDLTLFKRKRKRERLLFLSGWLLRDYDSVLKHKDFIKKIFEFNESVIDECNSKILQPRLNNSLLIGVHIRRGDYNNFLGGKYYYNLSVYRDVLDQLKLLFSPKNQEISFMICTNDHEIQYSNLFKDKNIFHSGGSQITDLCVLSRCDYIIGPPSTYSAWASFYGDVPLAYINKKDQIIKLSDFKVIEG